MKNLIADRLREIATEIREHPERWTQGHAARNAKGTVTGSTSEHAVCWCALGFCWREGKKRGASFASQLEQAIFDVMPNVGDWNDTPGRTAEDVADLFDRVARTVEKA